MLVSCKALKYIAYFHAFHLSNIYHAVYVHLYIIVLKWLFVKVSLSSARINQNLYHYISKSKKAQLQGLSSLSYFNNGVLLSMFMLFQKNNCSFCKYWSPVRTAVTLTIVFCFFVYAHLKLFTLQILFYFKLVKCIVNLTWIWNMHACCGDGDKVFDTVNNKSSIVTKLVCICLA